MSLIVSIRASTRRRHIAYPFSAGCAFVAAYVYLRVKIPEPRPGLAPGSAVGDADAFLGDVTGLAGEFDAWASTRGLVSAAPPSDLREWIWEHRDDIGDDWDKLFRPTVAAYGESLRRKDPRAVWSRRAGDVVVEVPGRPWTRTWVALEMHETLYTDL